MFRLTLALLLQLVAGLQSDAGLVFQALNLNSAREVKPDPPEFICLGNNTKADCFDPRDPKKCRPGTSKRPAITFTFDQYIPWKFNSTWYKEVKKEADRMNAALVLLLPADEAPEDDKHSCNMLSLVLGLCAKPKRRIPIPESELMVIEKYFRIVRTPWVVPPGLNQGVPREGGCCGAREFMKFNAMALEEYDAVVNLDTDFTILGSLQPLFDCAASGMFLSARGSISGVNGGMFAVRPSQSLLYDIIVDLSLSKSSEETGWNGRGLAPQAEYGSAGVQGFLYYYFYQRGPGRADLVTAQVDPCQWTGAIFCEKKTCDVSPLRHKIRCPDGK